MSRELGEDIKKEGMKERSGKREGKEEKEGERQEWGG